MAAWRGSGLENNLYLAGLKSIDESVAMTLAAWKGSGGSMNLHLPGLPPEQATKLNQKPFWRDSNVSLHANINSAAATMRVDLAKARNSNRRNRGQVKLTEEERFFMALERYLESDE